VSADRADRDGSNAESMILPGGERVRIRPVRPTDGAALLELHANMSPESVYQRFFGLNRIAVEKYVLDRLTRPPSVGHQSMTAWADQTLIGVASYEQTEPHIADFAVVVADGWRERGIGTVLGRHLASVAQHHGITTFHADVLGGNVLAERLVRDLGFTSTVHYDGGVGAWDIELDHPTPSTPSLGPAAHP